MLVNHLYASLTDTVSHRYSVHAPLNPDAAACLLPEPGAISVDELEEDESLPALEYQKLIVRKVCRCAWQGSDIPNFLVFLNTFAQ